MKYEILLYATSSDFDGLGATETDSLFDTMDEAKKSAEDFLDDYFCVKVQSTDQEEIEIVIEKSFNTVIPFMGYYETIHGNCIDLTVENESDYALEELGKTKKQVEDWEYTIDYQSIRVECSKHYTEFAKDELGLKTLLFHDLASPREYNFSTDRIFCTIGQADITRLYDLYINSEAFKALLIEDFTARDGFNPYYSNDVSDWLAKPLEAWDHNEIGTLIQCHWNVLEIKEDDSLDWNMQPMHEIVMNGFPEWPEGAVNG